MALNRDTSGLLVRYIANDGNDPFNTGDWEEGAGVTSTTVDGTSGRLILTPNGLGYWRHSGTGASSRSKRMVQSVIRTVSAGSNNYPSVAVHMESGAGTHDDAALAGLVVEDDGFNHGFFVAERDDDVKVGSTEGSLPYKSHDTDYRISNFVDGTSLTGYDHTEAETLNLTLTNISSGHAGFTQCCSTDPAEVSEFWDCTDKVITCSGLPTGYKLKVRNGSATVLKSATESSGTATLDVMDVNLSNIADIVVTDGSDVVQDTFTPSTGEYIVGGDSYSFSQAGEASFVRTITLDQDEKPEISSIDAEVDDAGNVTLSYSGDDDVESIRYDTSTSSYPTAPTGGTGGTPNDGRTDDISIGSLTEGQTMFVSVVAYASTGGTGRESEVSYRTQTTYRTDTDTQRPVTPSIRTVWNGSFRKDGLYWGAPGNGWALAIEDPGIDGKSLKFTSSTTGGMGIRNHTIAESFTDQAKEDWVHIEVEEGDKVLARLEYDTPAQLIAFKVNYYPGDLSGNLKKTLIVVPSGTGTATGEWIVPAGVKFITPMFEQGADSVVRDYIIDNVHLEIIPSSSGELSDWPGGIARTSGRINENDLLKNLPKNFVTVSNLEDGDMLDFSGTGLDLGFDAAPKWAVARYGKSYEPDATNWPNGFSSSLAQRMLVELYDLDADGATVRARLQQPPTQQTEPTTTADSPITSVGGSIQEPVDNLPATNDNFTVRFELNWTGGGDGGGSGGAWYKWEVDVISIGSNVTRATHTFTEFVTGTSSGSSSTTVNITASDMLVDLADDIRIEVKSGPTYVSGNIKQIISSWEVAAGSPFVEHQYAGDPDYAIATDASLGITVAFRLWDEA